MEAGMIEGIKKRHGYTKTKELFLFDDGLSERQSAFVIVARPILAALSALDGVGEDDESDNDDPDSIKDLLEDALVLLGNANFRLNAWRQKRFSEFLTKLGKRTLREGIPADKHLFPDKFHAKIKSDHDHSSTNSKLISTPPAKRQFKQPYKKDQPFCSDYRSNDNSRVGGKRKWGFGLLVAEPVQADYPLPVLETLNPPTDKSVSRLQFFAQNWKKRTQDSWTIQGYKTPFCRHPRQRCVRITRIKSHT